MAYCVYTLRVAVRGRPARSASTSARARTTSPSASTIAAAELADVGAGNSAPGELERAKENLKGRLLLSLESHLRRA